MPVFRRVRCKQVQYWSAAAAIVTSVGPSSKILCRSVMMTESVSRIRINIRGYRSNPSD